jgi:hypothetical protein
MVCQIRLWQMRMIGLLFQCRRHAKLNAQMRARPNLRSVTSLNSAAVLALSSAHTQTVWAFRSSTSPNQCTPYNKPIKPIARGWHAAREALLWIAPLSGRRASALRACPYRPNPPAVLTAYRCVIRTVVWGFSEKRF